MSRSYNNAGYWGVFWPLVLLALLVRLSFGGIVSPQELFDNSVTQLDKLSVFCDHHTLPDGNDHSDNHQHSSDDGQSGFFLLADAFELLSLSFVVIGLFQINSFGRFERCWFFPVIRGPPFRQNSPFCPQGPPA